MKIFALILLFLLIIGLGSLPFLLPPTIHESLSISASLVGTMASLVTLLIAILLYSKYGVEKSVLEKQTETVLRFLTELKKTRIWLLSSHANLQLKFDWLQDKYWERVKDKKLLFDIEDYSEGLNNIWELADDVFLPIEIAKKIKPLTVVFIESNRRADEYMKDEYMKVVVTGYPQDSKKNHTFGVLNGKPITVEEFVKLWIPVIEATKKWLQKHSNIVVDLNFQSK